MIESFTDKLTKLIYEGKWVKKFQSFYEQAERRLQILDSTISLDDLKKLPSNHFEVLKDDRKGQYSIRINKQWSICFQWKDSKIHNVEIVDYH